MDDKNEFQEFNEAMAKFQQEYEAPKKDKKVDYTTNKGQRIKYEYADLESLQKAIRSTAAKHGLSWNVDFEYKETSITSYGKQQTAIIILTTVIINHASGTEKRFQGVPLFFTSMDPQSIGSTKTYAERYALSGAFGIASDDDDDAQVSQDSYNNPQQQQKLGPSQAELEAEANISININKYRGVLEENGIDLGQMNQWIAQQEGATDIKQVPPNKILAYYKSQALKIQKEAKQAEAQPEQMSMMKDRTTSPIDWGN